MWGIHNDQPKLDLVENGFVSIGWPDMGDLRPIGDDKEAMKSRVRIVYPDAKPGAIPGTAGMLLAFAHRMQIGDLVVYPHKPDSTLNFGRIESDYRYDPGAELHRNRRDVTWLKTAVPRTTFSQAARYEVGSAMTIFRVKNHLDEFLAYIEDTNAADTFAAEEDPDEAVESASDEPSAERIETYTRDFIIETLMTQLEGEQFEHFVAQLLEAAGYKTRVTQRSGDGGIDVIAHRDPLGLEPPIIKVQCKRTTGSTGGPTVQQLTGALAPGGTELGLFVTLGAFSKDAQHIARTRQDLRLVNGDDLVDLVFAHYENLRPEYKRLIPLRSLYAVDRSPDLS